MDGGTASLHSYNEGGSDEAEPAMGIPVNEKLEAYVEPQFQMRDAWANI